MSDTRAHHQYVHHVADAEAERIVTMVAEMRALELVSALRHAVNGAPHWRLEAQNLLILIDGGVPPTTHRTPPHQHDEAA